MLSVLGTCFGVAIQQGEGGDPCASLSLVPTQRPIDHPIDPNVTVNSIQAIPCEPRGLIWTSCRIFISLGLLKVGFTEEPSTDGILGMYIRRLRRVYRGDPREHSAIPERFPGSHQRDVRSDV
ncbi:hypothetical protein BDM02DRAFT_395819 [Thelephora ganbajun]|uniref:Uncharacterized protein n=1 Tax=Thelephora ganbajun TaxID=370292 RepID=A0ACB6Z8I6_THEGA|nr:hypothetical protein BDM02DRAFT_395819 [Thelephora ganbajun]